MAAPPARPQSHFGSLDDRLLNDLGLERSAVQAAEYGLIPGDVALHQPKKEADVSKSADPSRQPCART